MHASGSVHFHVITPGIGGLRHALALGPLLEGLYSAADGRCARIYLLRVSAFAPSSTLRAQTHSFTLGYSAHLGRYMLVSTALVATSLRAFTARSGPAPHCRCIVGAVAKARLASRHYPDCLSAFNMLDSILTTVCRTFRQLVCDACYQDAIAQPESCCLRCDGFTPPVNCRGRRAID
jgi:hypothetical protein